MAKLIEFENKSIDSIITEIALIKEPVTSGSNKTITLDNNDSFSADDYVIIGEIGNPQTEIAQITSTSGSTNITVNELSFARNTEIKVQKMPYNQIKLYHADTESGSKTLLSTKDMDVNDMYTSFTSTETSGYFFFSLYNSTTSTESKYTHPINAGGLESNTRMSIYNLIKGLYKGDSDDDLIYSLIDIAEHEIAGERRWKWTEKKAEFTTTIDKQEYDLVSDLNITDFKAIFAIEYEDYPIHLINIDTSRRLQWITTTSTIPNSVAMWDETLIFSHKPSEEKTVTIYYYCTTDGFTDTTSVSFPQAIAFRVLQDLWAGEDQQRSRYYEKRYQELLRIMKREDTKQTGVFGRLSIGNKQKQYDRFTYVNIET
jgi:hypothetical protein